MSKRTAQNKKPPAIVMIALAVVVIEATAALYLAANPSVITGKRVSYIVEKADSLTYVVEK